MLTQLAPTLWTLVNPLHLGPLHIDHTMTIARLADDQLWIHSPVAYTPALGQALATLGTPTHFIAPSTFHDLYWKEWFAAYPQARFYAVPGVREEHPELPFTSALEQNPPSEWDGAFEQVLVGGMPKLNEVAFLHKDSNTAVITDLVFNYAEDPGFPFATRCILKMSGTYNRYCGVSRLLRTCFKDKRAVRHSLDEIIAWEFSGMVVGHGRAVATNGNEALREAYSFLEG
ncbi:MAG: hypothetical protein ACI906_002940 [Candidatus Latescibacterota bacterium]|jgi:hypothetical protein